MNIILRTMLICLSIPFLTLARTFIVQNDNDAKITVSMNLINPTATFFNRQKEEQETTSQTATLTIDILPHASEQIDIPAFKENSIVDLILKTGRKKIIYKNKFTAKTFLPEHATLKIDANANVTTSPLLAAKRS